MKAAVMQPAALADLLAGAAASVAKSGTSNPTDSILLLRPIILPLIEQTSLVSTDGLDPFSSAACSN